MSTRTIRVDEEVVEALRLHSGVTWNDRARDALRMPPRGRPFTVLVDPTGWREHVGTPEDAVEVARVLLAEARRAGHPVPRANFYANGKLVRADVTRSDLATDLGVCWCGRGALRGYPRPGEAFCCAPHEALWGDMSRRQRARVIVARFIAIYAGANVR